MKNLLIIEGRETIGGGQIVTKKICDVLSDKYNLGVFLPGDNNTPLSKLLVSYRLIHFRYHEYSRGKKKIIDFFWFLLNALTFIKIHRVIKKEKFSIIYIQHTSMLPLVLMGSIGLDVKIVIHKHIFWGDKRVLWLANKLMKTNKVKLIFGVSDYCLSQLDPVLFTKCKLLYNPVDILECHKQNERSRAIAIIGDVVPVKGQHLLLEAVSMLNEEYVVHIIGNIVDINYINRMRNEFPMVDVIFTGMILDVPSYCENNSIDLVVIASCSSFETFSLAMVEAWSQGIPTIATKDFGMKELVDKFFKKYQKFMLFEMNNALDLSSKIDVLESDEVLYNNISKEIMDVAHNKFNIHNFSAQLTRTLEKL